jgi:hypothetical protein
MELERELQRYGLALELGIQCLSLDARTQSTHENSMVDGSFMNYLRIVFVHVVFVHVGEDSTVTGTPVSSTNSSNTPVTIPSAGLAGGKPVIACKIFLEASSGN